MPGIRSRLAAGVFGGLAALVLAEIVLRLLGTEPGRSLLPLAGIRLPARYDRAAVDRFASGRGVLKFDAELGWVTTPGYEGDDGRFVQRHNDAGLRANREYAPTPPPGIRRFAAYGDSFTYCSDVDLEDCWTHRLENSLRDAEVLNFGVPAYGPDQAWLRYRRDGAGWHPCAVLIGHMLENINRVVNRFRPFLLPGADPLAKPRLLRDGDGFRWLPVPFGSPADLADPASVEAALGPHDFWYFRHSIDPAPLDALEIVRLARAAIHQHSRRRRGLASMYRPGSEALDIVTAVLVGFADEVRARGPTPVVLLFPHEGVISNAGSHAGDPMHLPLLEALARHGVATIDLLEPLQEQARTSGASTVIRGHYLPAGNATVAHILAARLPALTAGTCGPG